MNKLLQVLPLWLRPVRLPGVAIASCRRGTTAIEYALIAALLVIALVGVLEGLRDSMIGLPMNRISEAIAAVLS